jgi:amino acid transporter
MPFLLMIGLLIAYARKREDWRPERKVPAVYEIAFGVAATLVAILLLRAVLVPSSLPTLTRLDIVFGTGVAFLVAVSLAWIFIWEARDSPPREEEGFRIRLHEDGSITWERHVTRPDGPVEES